MRTVPIRSGLATAVVAVLMVSAILPASDASAQFVFAWMETPPGQVVERGQQDVWMGTLMIEGEFWGEARLESLTFDLRGTGNDGADIDAIRIVHDEDWNGVADPWEPTVEVQPQADDERIVIEDPPIQVRDWMAQLIFLYDFAGNAAGGWYEFEIRDVDFGDEFEFWGEELWSARMTIEPENVAFTYQAPPDEQPFVPGDAPVEMGRLSIRARPDAATLTQLHVELTDGDPARLKGLHLWHDVDANGELEDGEPEISTIALDGKLPGATFDIAGDSGGLQLLPDQPVELVITGDFETSRYTNMLFRLTATGATVQDNVLPIAGLPIPMHELRATDNPQPAVRAHVRDRQPRRVEAGSAREVVAQLMLDAVDVATGLLSVAIDGSGSGHEVVDLQIVELILDVNANGEADGIGIDGGDRLLDSGVYQSDDGAMLLTTGSVGLTSGTRTRLLVAYTFQASARDGGDFRVTVSEVNAVGSTPVTGLPATSSSVSVDGPSVNDTPDTPGDGGGDIYLGTAGGAGCTTATGSGPAWPAVAILVGIAVSRRRVAGPGLARQGTP